jgi:HPt (histidine-containing phosphotransfer) domain-containing protein
MSELQNDFQVLNLKAALEMVDNDKNLYRTLLESFINDIPFSTQHLKDLIADDKKEEGAKYVHLVKGAGRQLGTERFGSAAQKLENILRGKETGDIQSLTDDAVLEYNLALAAIKNALANLT